MYNVRHVIRLARLLMELLREDELSIWFVRYVMYVTWPPTGVDLSDALVARLFPTYLHYTTTIEHLAVDPRSDILVSPLEGL